MTRGQLSLELFLAILLFIFLVQSFNATKSYTEDSSKELFLDIQAQNSLTYVSEILEKSNVLTTADSYAFSFEVPNLKSPEIETCNFSLTNNELNISYAGKTLSRSIYYPKATQQINFKCGQTINVNNGAWSTG
jgi:hypothetical protein